MLDISDPRLPAAGVLISTLLINTIYTWSALPYFPIEFSQMGFQAAGGYYVMATGMSLAGSIMFRYHIVEGRMLGAVGAVFMALLAIVNGDDTAVLRVVHAAIALTCFTTYVAYIYVNGGTFTWLAMAIVAIVIGHAIILTRLDYSILLKHGISEWKTVWETANDSFPVWIRQLKAVCQWTMIIALYVSMFSIPSYQITNAKTL